MASSLSPFLLQRTGDCLARQMGLHYPPERHVDLLQGLERAAPAFGFPGVAEFVAWLLAAGPLTREQIQGLAAHLSVGETYFFREPAVFAALEREVLPPLIAERRRLGRRQLRLWSAACCTGEEPYSLAILLARLIPDLMDWDVRILATDIQPGFLAQAAQARYRDWSFRGVPAWLKAGYFQPLGGGVFTLAPRLQRLVHFEYLNLADPVYSVLQEGDRGIDLILCRNVLMYFDEATARAVADRLLAVLRPGGWLAVSPTEADARLFTAYATVHCPGAILYRRPGPGVVPQDLGDVLGGSPGVAPAEDAASVPGAVAETPAPVRTQPTDNAEAMAPAAAPVSTGSPRDRQVPALLARSLANAGRLDEAERWCATALASNRYDAGMHYLLATIHDARGRRADAAAEFERALYLEPAFVLAHVALAGLHRREGRGERAARHIAEAQVLLRRLPADAVLPESDGLTAGSLLELIGAARGLA